MCVKGEEYIYAYGSLCYPCGNYRPTGNQPIAYEFCEAIGGHIVFDGDPYCVCNSACTKGESFINSKGNCLNCSLVDKAKIGAFDIDREHCLACSTAKRFWTGSYCYRCDTAETPDVITEAEENSCTSCSERKVADGKCVLKQ